MPTDTFGKWTALRNGDYSGDVEICSSIDGQKLVVPFAFLFYIVAGYVRDRKLAALEQASEREVMGLPDD